MMCDRVFIILLLTSSFFLWLLLFFFLEIAQIEIIELYCNHIYSYTTSKWCRKTMGVSHTNKNKNLSNISNFRVDFIVYHTYINCREWSSKASCSQCMFNTKFVARFHILRIKHTIFYWLLYGKKNKVKYTHDKNTRREKRKHIRSNVKEIT